MSERRNIVDQVREGRISVIRGRDQEAYGSWRRRHPQSTSLAFSDGALRHLIPKKIFDLAVDPTKIQLKLVNREEGNVGFYIVEPRSTPLPAEDEMLTRYHEDVDSGLLDRADFVAAYVDLERKGARELEVIFAVHPDLRRQGVGREFYDRLRTVAINGGYRYLTGQNNETNIAYFTQVLGRKPLGEVDAAISAEIRTNHNDDIENEQFFTVDVLPQEQ